VKYVFTDGKEVDYSITEMKILRVFEDIMGDAQLDSDYDLRQYYDNGGFNSDVIRNVFQKKLKKLVLSDADPKYIIDRTAMILSSTLYAINAVYNEVALTSFAYMYSTTIDDMIQILTDKDLVNAMAKLKDKKTETAVKNIYKVLDNVMEKPEYSENALVISFMASIMNKGQFKQGYGTRGFTSDLVANIINEPIVSSYGVGLQGNYERTANTMDARISILYAETGIQTSETFANKLQTVGALIDTLVYEDCGTNRSMEHTLAGPGLNSHEEWYGGDLPSLTGTRYKLHKDDAGWLVFDGTEEHLYGKTVYIRVAWHCELEDPQSVCVNCLGAVAYTSHPGYNIGLFLLSRITEILNQMILSTKHLIASAVTDAVFLHETALNYLKIRKDGDITVDKAKLPGGVIHISLDEFYGYKDLEGKDLNSIMPGRLSRISHILVDETGKCKPVKVTITDSKRKGILSREFIEYLMKYNTGITEGGYLKVPMTKWKPSSKMIQMPAASFDYRAYGASINSTITSAKGLNKHTRASFLLELHELVSRKFTVSIGALSLIPLIMSQKDPLKGDYRITRGDKYKLVSLNDALHTSSISVIYGTGTLTPLNSIDTANENTHMRHPLDVYFCPQEAVEAERRRKGFR